MALLWSVESEVLGALEAMCQDPRRQADAAVLGCQEATRRAPGTQEQTNTPGKQMAVIESTYYKYMRYL